MGRLLGRIFRRSKHRAAQASQQLAGRKKIGDLKGEARPRPFSFPAAVDAQRAASNFPYEAYNRERYEMVLASLKQRQEHEQEWTKGKLADLTTICQQVLNKTWLVA